MHLEGAHSLLRRCCSLFSPLAHVTVLILLDPSRLIGKLLSHSKTNTFILLNPRRATCTKMILLQKQAPLFLRKKKRLPAETCLFLQKMQCPTETSGFRGPHCKKPQEIARDKILALPQENPLVKPLSAEHALACRDSPPRPYLIHMLR